VRRAVIPVCREVGDFQWVRIPSGQSVARPEAIRAAQEVTNALKYSGVTVTLGDLATMQAET
jgi:hypothetical protein